jgi:segregation and condensation protein A
VETDFKIKMGDFEGPLELLLDLIEKRKLHINDISLSQVADEFVAHIKSYEEFPIADSADFILIASTLLLIKSKSLLPNLQLTEDEEGNIEDLERRLALYKRFKDLAKHVDELYMKAPLYFANESRQIYSVFSPTAEVTKENILSNIKNVLQNIAKPEKLATVVVQKVISLEKMIENLTERVNKSLKMSFREFSKFGKTDKVNVIVSFLAMLELVKQGVVRVSQSEHYDDIEIETEKVSTPQYSS